MAVHYRTQGFVIKKTDRREADQLLTIFTENYGKLEIFGKAIRKITSKLRAGTELFYLSDIEFIQGKTQKTLTDAILIEKFPNIRKDLKKLRIAHRISEVLDDSVAKEEKDDQTWKLLKEVFEKLDELEIKNLEILYYYFFWNIFSTLGYQPEVYQCSICRKKLAASKLYFSFEAGGTICQACAKHAKNVQMINPDFIKIIRIILRKDWETLSRLKIEFIHQRLLRNISQYYKIKVDEK